MNGPVEWEFSQKDLSARDAHDWIRLHPGYEFQLVSANADPQKEVAFHWDEEQGQGSVSLVAPVILMAELGPSHMYVDFHLRGLPMYVTIPVMATITLGWSHTVGDHSGDEARPSEPPANS